MEPETRVEWEWLTFPGSVGRGRHIRAIQSVARTRGLSFDDARRLVYERFPELLTTDDEKEVMTRKEL